MIGIFDSGVGGLTVARALEDAHPGTDLIYLGDTACFPYGGRSTHRIAANVDQGIRFLIGKGATLIVLACAASSAAWLRRGGGSLGVPVVDVITSSVERLFEFPPCGCVGIIGTEAALREGLFQELIRKRNPDATVHAHPTPLLVPLIEEGWAERPETRMIVKKYLHPLKVRQVDALIMGCNHYSSIKRLIQRKIGRRTLVVDSSTSAAARIETMMSTQQQQAGESCGVKGAGTYCLTDVTERIAAVGKKMFGRNLSFQECTLF